MFMRHSRGRSSARQGLERWINRDEVLDSWIDQQWKRSITLYGLADPLRDEGYVAVARRSDGSVLRSVVLLIDGDQLTGLEPGTALRALDRRARHVTRERAARSPAAGSPTDEPRVGIE